MFGLISIAGSSSFRYFSLIRFCKPKEIAEKMVEGRMKKFTGEVSLTGQPFVMDPSVSVGDFLKSVNTSVSNFIRLEVGEGNEKKEEDFAAEVAKITGGNA